jgi:hypothetical protein
VRRAIEWQARAVTGDESIDYSACGTTGPGFACLARAGQRCVWGAGQAMLVLARVPTAARSLLMDRAIRQGTTAFRLSDSATAQYPMGYGNARPKGVWFSSGSHPDTWPIYSRISRSLWQELLWLCEAAHMPAIWAAQVLESLAQKGLPSRAEITDAAMADRAECVMLNKGPYVVQAVRVLDDILSRMQEHQRKKRPTLRKLSVSAGLDGV